MTGLFELIIISLLKLFPLLIVIAFFTLSERKVMASVQRRLGPNTVGINGLLQPIADGLKLLLKEIIIPSRANFWLFLFSPVLMVTLSFSLWCFVPFNFGSVLVDSRYGLLVVFTLSSLNVYNLVLAG